MLIRKCEQLGVAYASSDWSPLSDITFALLLKRAGIQWQYVALEGVAEIVWPPVCGVHLMQVERQQTPGEKRLAMRHGLAHVLAGDTQAVRYTRGGHDCFEYEERVADLFALADLIPDRVLADRRSAGYTELEITWWTWCEVKRYAPSWPTVRIADRVALRLKLFEGRDA